MAQRGFTLTELLIVLLLSTLLLVSGIPAFSQLQHRLQADHYLQSLSQYLTYARTLATTSRQTIIMCPVLSEQCQPDWNLPQVKIQQILPDSSVRLLQQLPEKPRQHQLFYNRSQLSFRHDGSLDALENGTFYYCPPEQLLWHYRLTLNQAGRQRLVFHNTACPQQL